MEKTKKIGTFLFWFAFILLITAGLQAIAQGWVGGEPFSFKSYQTMGWIVQLVYWIASLGGALYVAADEIG